MLSPAETPSAARDDPDQAEGPFLAEMEELQDRVAEARLDLQAGSSGITSALRERARSLETFVTRADFSV